MATTRKRKGSMSDTTTPIEAATVATTTPEAAAKVAAGNQILLIDPDSVELNQANSRKDFSKIPELLAQVVAAKEIQQVCLVVAQTEDAISPYKAIDGNCRTICAKLIKDRAAMNPEQLRKSFADFEVALGYEPVLTNYALLSDIRIPSIVIPEEKAVDRKYMLALQFFAGTGQRQLSLAEQADNILELYREHGSMSKVAVALARPNDKGTFSRIKTVYETKRNPKILEAINDKRLDVIGAAELITGSEQLAIPIEDLLAQLIEYVTSRSRYAASQALIREFLELKVKEKTNPPAAKTPSRSGDKPILSSEESLILISEGFEVLKEVYEAKSLPADALAAIASKVKWISDFYVKASVKKADPAEAAEIEELIDEAIGEPESEEALAATPAIY